MPISGGAAKRRSVSSLRLSRFPGHLDRAGEYPANEVSWKRRIGPIAKNSRKTRFAA